MTKSVDAQQFWNETLNGMSATEWIHHAHTLSALHTYHIKVRYVRTKRYLDALLKACFDEQRNFPPSRS